MILAEYVDHIITEPILTEQECNDFREVLNEGNPSVEKLDAIFKVAEAIDFINSAESIKKILIYESLNYLFQDSTASEENEQVDWIELATGDRFLKYLDKYNIPIEFKKELFLTIEYYAKNNLSVLLTEAINNSKL